MTGMKVKRTAYAAAIDAAGDRSAERWTAELRRREGVAFRAGYADAMVGKKRLRKQPLELRRSYLEGQARARVAGDAFAGCEAP